MTIDRRGFLAGAMASTGFGTVLSAHEPTEPYVIPEEHLPRVVRLRTQLEPGEIHVDPAVFALYWTLPENEAIRYAVGIGKGKLYHAGEFTVGRKAEWPSWKPTANMMAREPAKYRDFRPGAKYQNGQPGGVNNPLGARALYLYNARGHDTYLRIHGTNAPWTIGTAVSNGCARLVNDHAIDLYDRVPVGTRVMLYPKGTVEEQT